MLRVAALIAAILTLQACVSVRSYHGYALERGQDELIGEAGLDTKESVLAKFGEPSLIGTFDRNAWYYMNSADETRAFFKPTTKARSVVAFYFDPEGVLKEMDEFDLADGGDIKLVSRATPTRGRELNFWEQLLGNVGRLPAGVGGEGQVPGQ
ncbi:MAG: SmpA/OmlA family lipoprotein [Hyphococcus sp.]|nr:MAG: SmpA/OmlA family lipoprotein [Marinicaulis sp.]